LSVAGSCGQAAQAEDETNGGDMNELLDDMFFYDLGAANTDVRLLYILLLDIKPNMIP
jgi:hypothetical protein